MSAAAVVVIVVIALVLLSGGLALRARRRPLAPPPEAPSPLVSPVEVEERHPQPEESKEPVAQVTGFTEVTGVVADVIAEVEPPPVEPPPVEEPPAPARSFRQRLSRAAGALGSPLSAIRGRAKVDEATFQDLEEALLLADVGLPTTTRLLEPLRDALRNGSIGDSPAALLDALKQQVVALFDGEDRNLDRSGEPPVVWLFVGVNGVGKTTTIGKLAARTTGGGSKVVLAAGDTFRAAAGEQLDLWSERAGTEIIRGAEGADPSSVIFDAIQHAAAVRADLVLADTAGRLHTRTNLMEELKKVRRVADRPPGNVREVLLVIDATTGQNGLAQAREFAEAVGVTGIVLTKLDGTAKGGIVLAIRAELALPIKLVGLGEGIDDLMDFDPAAFTDALFD